MKRDEKLLQKAEALRPQLLVTEKGVPGDSRALSKGGETLLDFGDHYVGYLTLHLKSTGRHQDAPVLLELHMDEAIIRLEGDRMEVRSGNSIRECAQESTAALGRAYWGSGHPACIEDFYRSIKARAPYANSPAACDVTMRTLLTLYNQCHLTLNGSES